MRWIFGFILKETEHHGAYAKELRYLAVLPVQETADVCMARTQEAKGEWWEVNQER